MRGAPRSHNPPRPAESRVPPQAAQGPWVVGLRSLMSGVPAVAAWHGLVLVNAFFFILRQTAGLPKTATQLHLSLTS